MFMNVICSISDVVGKVNKKMWYSIMFSVKKPKMSGGVRKSIGGFLKNLGTFLFSHTVRKYK